jgi:hypothetical protein
MQVLITHGRLARTRVMQFSAGRCLLAALALAFVLMGAVGHGLPLRVPEGRARGLAGRQPDRAPGRARRVAQRDRFMRENLDAMAQKVGEMQAKLVKLEAMGDRVSGLAGVKPEELQLQPLRDRQAPPGGRKGGPYVPLHRPSLEQLQRTVAGLDEATDWHTDLFTFSESRLLQARLEALRVPSAPPVEGRSARASAFAPTPSPAARRCTPGWTSRPTRARPSSPRPAAWCWHRLARRVRPHGRNRPRQRPGDALRPLRRRCWCKPWAGGQARAAMAEVGNTGRSTGRTCTSRCWCTACPRTRPASWPAAGPVQAFAQRRALIRPSADGCGRPAAPGC